MAKDRSLLLDDDEPSSSPKRTGEMRDTPRFGFEWGLASTIVGATLLIASPMVLMFCLFFWGGNRELPFSSSETNLVHAAGVVICVGAVLLSILGIFFGGRGLGRARQARQPAALGVCGMLLCFAALIAWLIITVDWIMIMDSYRGSSVRYY